MFSLKSITISLIFILLAHIIATFNYWYWTYTWFDIPMHFLGGFWVAMVYFWINAKVEILNSEFSKLPKWLVNLLFILSFIALIGVLWEFYEFIFDFFNGKTGMFQGSSADTMGDLFFDLVGGTTAFAIFYRKLGK
ncbi:hypothetical protein A3J77_01170 [Candidatus Wolfebacteria bacterium RBG_13_41_7]|uniref:DUF2238 domain-containing protein n=1 Tax=Candidatus Wolfebacteria bacterium RBG_13_41_7 TaxID=1802554 RepID=A0A1F8DL84_9BACT|nr:MAG: hypothetical protein A3J77_01170 [Candidatus Wolfebacteria bacterium RBG_13_41_7]